MSEPRDFLRRFRLVDGGGESAPHEVIIPLDAKAIGVILENIPKLLQGEPPYKLRFSGVLEPGEEPIDEYGASKLAEIQKERDADARDGRRPAKTKTGAYPKPHVEDGHSHADDEKLYPGPKRRQELREARRFGGLGYGKTAHEEKARAAEYADEFKDELKNAEERYAKAIGIYPNEVTRKHVDEGKARVVEVTGRNQYGETVKESLDMGEPSAFSHAATEELLRDS